MGSHPNISHKKFPKQGSFAGQPCSVCFNYDTENSVPGMIVRDDSEEPGVGIIRLDDGRFILMTECQYRPLGLAVARGRA